MVPCRALSSVAFNQNSVTPAVSPFFTRHGKVSHTARSPISRRSTDLPKKSISCVCVCVYIYVRCKFFHGDFDPRDRPTKSRYRAGDRFIIEVFSSACERTIRRTIRIVRLRGKKKSRARFVRVLSFSLWRVVRETRQSAVNNNGKKESKASIYILRSLRYIKLWRQDYQQIFYSILFYTRLGTLMINILHWIIDNILAEKLSQTR